MNTPGTRNSKGRFSGLKQREKRRFKLLGGKAFLMCAALIVVLFFASGLQQVALRSSNIAAVVSAILVDLANSDRGAHGLVNLTMNSSLVAVAQAKANDMAEKSYFAHTSPEGIEPWYWFREIGYSYAHAGENLAIHFSDSADVERAWMNSPTHRDNILDPRYTEIGIATAQGVYQGRETTFVVQVFGTPAFATRPDLAVAESESATPETVVAAAPAESDVLGATEIQSEVVPVDEVPAWGYLFGYPKATLRYVYMAFALLILLALATETRFEFHAHHKRRAYRAGFLLACMAILFVVADYVFFAAPVLALG